MQLSKRLEMILKTIPESNVVSDIGTDHGFLGIRLIEEQKATRVIASDVNKGPLDRAKEHVSESGLENQIECRLGSGLSVLKKAEADTIVIAGMGGLLIIDLLETDLEIAKSASTLILSPHKDTPEVRRYLMEHDFQIVDEEMVEEDGKYYPIIRAIPHSENSLTEKEIQFGPILLKKKSLDFISFLNHEKERVEEIMERRKSGKNLSSDEHLDIYLQTVKEILEI